MANGKQVYGAKVVYTEPIGEKNFLNFKFMGGFSIENNDRTAVDVFEQVETPNSTLTDNYQKEYNFQEFKLDFKREVEKYNLRIATGIKRSALPGLLVSTDNPIRQEYYYPTGNFRLKYKMTKNKSVTLSYRTRVIEPRLDQFQPMISNQNPLSISLGNLNLIPAYNHHIWLNYNLWDQSTFTSCYINGYTSITQNAMINSRTIDDNFMRVFQPVNAGTVYSGGGYLGYNGEIKKLMKISLRGGANLHESPVLINGLPSKEFTHNYNAYFSVGNKKKKVVDLSATANVQIGNSIYSSNSSLNLTYINHVYSAKARVTIAKKWNISSNFEYRLYSNMGYAEAIAIPVWSAKFSRTFLKGDQLKIEFSAQNLLNEEFQVSRYNWDGNIAENQTNMLGRYFMLSVAYKINKMGGNKSVPKT